MGGQRFIVADGARIAVTPHALERYIERVRPGLDEACALHELAAVAQAGGTVTRVPPPWMLVDEEMGPQCDTYLLIGEDMVFPMYYDPRAYRVAATCITRGALSDRARAARQERRRELSQKRRMRRQEGMPVHSRASGKRKHRGTQRRQGAAGREEGRADGR
jgi:hypothetical protein